MAILSNFSQHSSTKVLPLSALIGRTWAQTEVEYQPKKWLHDAESTVAPQAPQLQFRWSHHPHRSRMFQYRKPHRHIDMRHILTDAATELSTSKHPNNYSLVFEGLHGQESPPLRRYWKHFVRHLSHLQVALTIPSQNILSRLRQSTPTHCHSKRVVFRQCQIY